MLCDVINQEMSRDTKDVSHPIEQVKHYLRQGRTSKTLLGACHLMMHIQALSYLRRKLNWKIPTNSSQVPKRLASTTDFSKNICVDVCPICLICLGIVSTKEVMKNEKKALLFINGLGNVFSSKNRVFYLLISFDACSYLLFQKFHP